MKNAKLGFDDISAFLEETVKGPDDQGIVDEAHNIFADLVRAKNS